MRAELRSQGEQQCHSQPQLAGSLPTYWTAPNPSASSANGYGTTTPDSSQTVQVDANGTWTYSDGDTYTPSDPSAVQDGDQAGIYNDQGQLIAGDGNMFGNRAADGLLGDMENNTQDAVSTSLAALTSNGNIAGQPDPQNVLLDVSRVLTSEGYAVSGIYACPNGYAVTATDPNGGGIAIISASGSAVDITQQTASGDPTPFNSEFRQQNVGGYWTTMFRMAGWRSGVYLPTPGFGPPSPVNLG